MLFCKTRNRAGDPAFFLYAAVSDDSPHADHVTVQNAAGQQFPVPSSLVDQIGAPPPAGTPTPIRWGKWWNSARPEARQAIESDPGSLQYLPFAFYSTFPRSQPDPVDNELRDAFIQLVGCGGGVSVGACTTNPFSELRMYSRRIGRRIVAVVG